MSSEEEEKPKPGYEALQKEQNQVKITIKNNFDVITRTLRGKEMLPKADYENVTDPLTLLPDNKKVDIVFTKLASSIDEDDDKFLKFLEIIRKKTNAIKTVDILEKAYKDKGGVIPGKDSTNPPDSGASLQGTGRRTELTDDHYGKIIEQLIPVKAQWESIAQQLGFKASEIKNIASSLVRIQDGNFINDVITTWLQWGPGDKRGSKDVATLEALQKALNNTNNARIILKL